MFRSTLLLLLALAAAMALPSCATTPPTPAELVAVGFRAPEQTFRTFQAAVGADLIDLEYRCYSDEFKREWEITQGNYRVARKQLFDEIPWIRRISRADVLGQTEIEPALVRLDARVSFLMQSVDVEVYLSRTDFYELWIGDERLSDGVLEFTDVVRRVSEGGDAPWDRTEMVLAAIELESPLAPNVAQRLDQISEVVVGREWRIAGLRLKTDQ
jgi:hypothetical protein